MHKNNKNIIKDKTISLCPVCFSEVDACVYERQRKVFLDKTCLRHGNFEVMIEKDVVFYKSLYNRNYLAVRVPHINLAISVTHDCNLACNICYLSPLERERTSMKSLKNKISNFQGKMIWLTGGEPTLREDLPEIIRYVCSCRKIPVLITNGIRLSDINYVYKLKQSGLLWTHFSFNGFDERSYEKINGQKLKKVKLKALKNLRKIKMKTALSFLYVKGVNGKEIKDVFCFCLQNHSFIQQLRIRTSMDVGKYIENEITFLSELVDVIANIFGLNKIQLLKFALSDGKLYNATYCADTMPCHLEIDILSLFKKYIAKNTHWRSVQILRIVVWLVKNFGLLNSLKICIENIIYAKLRFNFSIKLRSWWDKERIDLGEIQHCPSAYTSSKNETILPFCQAVVLNEKYHNL